MWQEEFAALLWVGVFGVLLLPGFGVSSSSPQVPPCNSGINAYFSLPFQRKILPGIQLTL